MLNLVLKKTLKRKDGFHFFLNPHSYVNLFKNKKFFQSLQKSQVIHIDGIGLLILLKIHEIINKKNYNLQRYTGFDFFLEKVSNSLNKNLLLIGKFQTLSKLKKIILISNPTCNVTICGLPIVKKNFNRTHIFKIKNKIKNIKKIDYCFVGVGAPKQEILISDIIENIVKKKICKIKNIAGVGAAFDYLKTKPSIFFFLFRYFGFEWIYRFALNPFKMWSRTVISFPVFVLFGIRNLMPYYYNLKLTKKINYLINSNKNFILSAFNLAFYSYLFKNKIQPSKILYLWPDGIFGNFFTKFKKLPGRKLISSLNINRKYKRFHILGKLSKNDKLFLKSKYNLPIKHTQLPFGTIDKILKKIPPIKKYELVLLTLPTPKQEQVANYLFKKNKFSKTICIGGGLGIASHDEKPCPNMMEKLHLEFLWRLGYQPLRRLLRLTETFLYLVISLIYFFPYRFSVNEQK